MSLQALRGRMPMIVFLLLALVCLAILCFACACLSDHPAQAIERALASIPAAPPLVEVWSLAFAALGSSAFVAGRRERIAAAPSQATLQRFLF